MCVVFVVALVVFGQTELRGVDFSSLHLSKVDSALLRRNSVLYSAKTAYGTETDKGLTVFPKWTKDKERYYPVMREAWLYCLRQEPYQLRLYKDGALFYQWMIGEARDSAQRAEYCGEMMALYDRQIEHLDSINAHVKRISDRASRGNVMIRKAIAYEYYVLGPAKEGEEYYSARRKRVMYPMYREAVEVMKETFDEGADNGGDVDVTGLKNYFRYAYLNFYDNFNAHLSNDSIDKQCRAEARARILEEYNFLKDFCERQIRDLGADYVDSLSVEGTDSLEVVQRAMAPYRDLMAFCDEDMKGSGLNVAVQTLEDAWDFFTNDLESHKDSLAWLYRLKSTCENTVDFSPENEYYDFYEKVEAYYAEALKRAQERGGASTRTTVAKYGGNPWYAKAMPLYNAVVAFSRSGRSNMDNGTFQSGLLCIYYLSQAVRTDPGNAAKYNRMKAWVGKGVSTEAFYRNVKRGQTVTVNGVTFTASF